MALTARLYNANDSPVAYQTPYSGSPYAAGAPHQQGGPGQMPPNYMMAGPMGNMPMSATGGMNSQQQMMPRMQPPQQSPTSMGTSTPQRQFTPSQASPTASMTPQQSQFSMSQASTLSQPGQSLPQQIFAGGAPQTPTFPSGGTSTGPNGTMPASTPMSPGTESKEKERFQLLLEINQELLYESVQLQNTKAELRREAAASTAESGGRAGGPDSADDKLIQQDYTQ
jgi:hypothetical protein